jgi:hypothetical protein
MEEFINFTTMLKTCRQGEQLEEQPHTTLILGYFTLDGCRKYTLN